MSRYIAFFLYLLCCLPIYAQESRVGVSLEHSGHDRVGREIAFYVRENLASSSRFILANTGGAIIGIRLVTLDAIGETDSQISAYSVVFTFIDSKGEEYYLTSKAGVCGINRVQSVGRNIFTYLDEASRMAYETYRRISGQ